MAGSGDGPAPVVPLAALPEASAVAGLVLLVMGVVWLDTSTVVRAYHRIEDERQPERTEHDSGPVAQ